MSDYTSNKLGVKNRVPMSGGRDLSFINALYGGYWNYDLKDFRYMINPYFPPQEMLDKIAASVGALCKNYPSI